jgi:hypothetical protein
MKGKIIKKVSNLKESNRMNCDYYIQKDLVIEYQGKNGRINTIYTDRNIIKGYIFKDIHTKYEDEIKKKIYENTFDEILFKNDEWVKEKSIYKEYLIKNFKEIVKLVKVYRKTSAWER